MHQRKSAPPISRWKLAIFSAVPALSILVFLFVTVEVGLRIRYRRIEVITQAAPWELALWQGLAYYWDTYHPRLGWNNLPGYASDSRVPFKLTINNQGLRAGRDYDSSPPPGKKRLIIFGDSFTFGEEVDDDQTVPAYLEAQLENVEVINFGVHAYGLGQMMLRLEEEGFAFHPDHVIVMFNTFFYQRDGKDHFIHNKPVFLASEGKLRIENVPVPELSRQPWLFQNCFTAAWLWGRPVHELQSHKTIAEAIELPTLIFKRMRKECQKRNVSLTLVFITSIPQIWDTNTKSEPLEVQATRRAIDQSEIDTIDLIDFLKEKYEELGPRLQAPLGHWSGEANQLIAGEVARHLEGAP